MIAIIDYGMGNLASIKNMLRKLNVDAVVTSDPEVIAAANQLILPGVGAFDTGMQSLRARGLEPILHSKVLTERAPILGICLGMQLMTHGSEEGKCEGLGWLEAETVRFQFDSRATSLKVPHMGWNSVRVILDSSLFADLQEPRFYFVHSYHPVCQHASDVLASTTYGYEFVSAFRRDNVFGVQFHPEKSHRYGMALLRNFAGMI